MKLQRLMRIAYKTDIEDSDPEYWGAFSVPFPAEADGRTVVSVNWATRGEVEVTWLVPVQ